MPNAMETLRYIVDAKAEGVKEGYTQGLQYALKEIYEHLGYRAGKQYPLTMSDVLDTIDTEKADAVRKAELATKNEIFGKLRLWMDDYV